MQSLELPRILCVDDQPNVLDGLRRTLRRGFDLVTAVGAQEGLAALESVGPFTAVVSDLSMPGMDGITFLEKVRESSPDTVRLLLTGRADLSSALEAVNRGAVFRFLVKPCAADVLQRALAAAVEQHRLVTSERVLLEQTLLGSIRALTEILALINPAGFGRAARAKALVGKVTELLGAEGGWQVEVAAMLSQLGTVTLPPATVEKIYAGRSLTYAETVAMEQLPRVACDLIAGIPRMGEVQEILTALNLRYDGKNTPKEAPRGDAIPRGARLLRVVLDYDLLESQGVLGPLALDALRGREGCYDPAMLELLAQCHGSAAPNQQVQEIELRTVRPGMVFAQDLHTTSGILLVARGQEVTGRLAERIQNFLHLVEAKQQVHVLIPDREGRAAGELRASA
jgi:response regulator RpfG family c-di-GMP phosphodiesterase